MKLQGKVAIVTGAGTGIGRACAEALAAEGAAVVLAGRRRQLLEQAAEALRARKGKAQAQECDITRVAHVEALVHRALDEFGGLHVVVNNAGAWMAGSVEETSEEELDHLLAVNLKGTFLVSKAAVPALRQSGGGSVINIGSILSLVGMKRRAAYTATKGAIALLTKAMALDHAAENIRVNCICPGLVDTPLLQNALAQASDPTGELARRIAGIPLGRIGKPEDVGRLAVFLASDDSSWMTGALLPLDGGFTAG
ncbi:MAG TPA: SDR family oxidoreductase [Candidatus Xenobia bacterium]|nr:SDR family oxidoreductase [Candidatus Xenobia bacterium]